MEEIVTVEVPDFLEADTEYDTQYRRTVKWDVEKGDFVRDGANRVQECSGDEGFRVWFYKAAMTERYACLAYPDEIGAEMEDAMDDDEEDIVESQVERAVTEALEVNPRTEWVGDFEFTWNGDVMRCAFYVKGVDMDKGFLISI